MKYENKKQTNQRLGNDKEVIYYFSKYDEIIEKLSTYERERNEILAENKILTTVGKPALEFDQSPQLPIFKLFT